MSEPEYDEATCITAKELRAKGIAVPAEIPDPAWVRRASIRSNHVAVLPPGSRDGKEHFVDFGVRFTEPFRLVAFDDVPVVVDQIA